MVKRHTWLSIALVLIAFVGGLIVFSTPPASKATDGIMCTRWDGPRSNWKVPEDSNGMKFPVDYRDWQVISIAREANLKEFAATLGNDIAVKAAREMKIHPWPDGTVLVRVVWAARKMSTWPHGVTAGKFQFIGMMVKDAEKYKDTLGWGFAQWDGMGLNAHATGKDQAAECMGCHSPLGKERDFVFTKPAVMP